METQYTIIKAVCPKQWTRREKQMKLHKKRYPMRVLTISAIFMLKKQSNQWLPKLNNQWKLEIPMFIIKLKPAKLSFLFQKKKLEMQKYEILGLHDTTSCWLTTQNHFSQIFFPKKNS